MTLGTSFGREARAHFSRSLLFLTMEENTGNKLSEKDAECRWMYLVPTFHPGFLEKIKIMGIHPFLLLGKFLPILDFCLDNVSAGQVFLYDMP